MPHRLQGRSIIWSQDFDTQLLEEIFKQADYYREHPIGMHLRDKRVIMLFYEESTRTRFSFEAAVQGLGGTCISTENARQFSSAAKGESFEDGIRVISEYGDAIVLRHFEDDAAMRARDRLQSEGIRVPIFNAGCGKGQHPTQSLMDLYTIKKEVGRTEGLTVIMVGDLRHGRTVRSLAYLLGKFPGNTIHFVAPWELAIGRDILAYLWRHDVKFTQSTDLGAVIESADVVYMTRIQKERFDNKELYERLKHSYRLTVELAGRMQPHARIMHPLPKVDEIEEAVDRLPQAAYFRQSDNGVLVRKTLLEMVLSE
jgi:aspartate carbamoyltransferase catalytic subunit